MIGRICRDDEGASAVEFALVLPLFLLLLFGTADFGFVLYTQSIMQDAAREGARRMSVDSTVTEAQGQAIAQNYLSTWPLPFTVAAHRPPASCATCVQVKVTLPASQAALLGDPFSIFTGTLTAQVTMRQES
jgi:Flp pilus assembly protein TadG